MAADVGFFKQVGMRPHNQPVISREQPVSGGGGVSGSRFNVRNG